MLSMDLFNNYNNFFKPDKSVEGVIRLGKYNYLNCLPVNLPLNKVSEDTIKSFYGTPAEINALLEAGEIDTGPISSIEYLKAREKYVLLDDISISSQRKVGSVILFSKYPFEELGDKNIAVTADSATSIQLLKYLLYTETNTNKTFTRQKSTASVDKMLENFDAILLIGDPALCNSYKYKDSSDIKQFDLAELWYKKTNHPMTFGVWVARKEWAESNPGALEYINNSLVKARVLGLNQLFDEVIVKAIEKTGLPPEVLDNYYKRQLSYNLTSINSLSISLFYSKIIENNLLQ